MYFFFVYRLVSAFPTQYISHKQSPGQTNTYTLNFG